MAVLQKSSIIQEPYFQRTFHRLANRDNAGGRIFRYQRQQLLSIVGVNIVGGLSLVSEDCFIKNSSICGIGRKCNEKDVENCGKIVIL